MNTGSIRSRSSKARLAPDVPHPDKRNSFVPHRYPVRLTQSAKPRRARATSAGCAPQGFGERILVPSIPLSTFSTTNFKANTQMISSKFLLLRRASVVHKKPGVTLGEKAQKIFDNHDRKEQVESESIPGIFGHEDAENEYITFKSRYILGKDVMEPRRQCWRRADSIWRTFDNSIKIKIDPGVDVRVSGIGHAHYQKYLHFLKNRTEDINRSGNQNC